MGNQLRARNVVDCVVHLGPLNTNCTPRSPRLMRCLSRSSRYRYSDEEEVHRSKLLFLVSGCEIGLFSSQN